MFSHRKVAQKRPSAQAHKKVLKSEQLRRTQRLGRQLYRVFLPRPRMPPPRPLLFGGVLVARVEAFLASLCVTLSSIPGKSLKMHFLCQRCKIGTAK